MNKSHLKIKKKKYSLSSKVKSHSTFFKVLFKVLCSFKTKLEKILNKQVVEHDSVKRRLLKWHALLKLGVNLCAIFS